MKQIIRGTILVTDVNSFMNSKARQTIIPCIDNLTARNCPNLPQPAPTDRFLAPSPVSTDQYH